MQWRHRRIGCTQPTFLSVFTVLFQVFGCTHWRLSQHPPSAEISIQGAKIMALGCNFPTSGSIFSCVLADSCDFTDFSSAKICGICAKMCLILCKNMSFGVQNLTVLVQKMPAYVQKPTVFCCVGMQRGGRTCFHIQRHKGAASFKRRESRGREIFTRNGRKTL